MNAPTAIDIKNIGEKLDDDLMRLEESDLEVLETWATSPSSSFWSPRLADWLLLNVEAEHKRRRFETADTSPIWVNLLSNSQLAAMLPLVTCWRRSTVSAGLEQWCETLHDLLTAAAIARLLAAEDN